MGRDTECSVAAFFSAQSQSQNWKNIIALNKQAHMVWITGMYMEITYHNYDSSILVLNLTTRNILMFIIKFIIMMFNNIIII